MPEDRIRQIVQEMIDAQQTKDQYEVAKTSYHTHNGIDSPRLGVSAGIVPLTVEDGATTVTPTTTISFTGATVTDGGNGEADVLITAGVAGSDTDIQFNDGGVFGGNGTFTYDKTTDTLTIGEENVFSVIQAPGATTSSTPGGSLTLNAGDGNGDDGGEVAILGGASGTATGSGISTGGGESGGTGGHIEMQGGDGKSIGDNPGGLIALKGGFGNGTASGGAITLLGGTSGTGKPGDVYINTSAIATNATGHFLVIPMCAGTPTGTPAGNARMVYDTSNNKLYVYNSGWKSVTLS